MCSLRPTLPPALWQEFLPDGRLCCLLCPRHCRLAEGQTGFCGVRTRHHDRLVCNGLAHWSGGCVDPIEKKPLYHFLPGTRIYSLGTLGCNLACRFCQNWHLSRARPGTRTSAGEGTTPAAIVATALAHDCPAVAFTYNDPVIYAEQAIAAAERCHGHGLRTVAVTAGYIEPAPRRAFFAAMDAANVDLKAFSDDFYRQQCGARLAPVLDTLRFLHEDTSVWLEVTTLLIPGLNDSAEELDRATDWFAAHLGPEVPWHFTAFHPAHRLADRPTTPVATLRHARTLALAKGLSHVYLGNLLTPEAGLTHCAGCGEVLIEREGFWVRRRRDRAGICPSCGRALAGVWS